MPRLCIGDLQCFQTFRNCSFSAPLGFYEISTVVMRIMLTMANIVLIIISNIEHTVYIRFTVFSNFSKLQFVLHICLLRNFYSCDAHHANYGKHSLNNHFQQWPHFVYEIYSVLKLFKIAVFFLHIWLLRNFYCGDAHHANYGNHCLNNRFQHCPDCV